MNSAFYLRVQFGKKGQFKKNKIIIWIGNITEKMWGEGVAKISAGKVISKY